MTTVINNPGEGNSGTGLIVGIIVAIIAIALFFMYGLPAMRGGAAPVPAPATGGSVNIELPSPAPAPAPEGN